MDSCASSLGFKYFLLAQANKIVGQHKNVDQGSEEDLQTAFNKCRQECEELTTMLHEQEALGATIQFSHHGSTM